MEKLEEIRETEQLELYHKSQVLLIRYMILKGIIQTPKDYIEQGFEGAFELLANGSISVPHEIDWREIQSRVKKAVNI